MEKTDILKDYILPVSTFLLGVFFTVLWEKRKKSNDDNQQAANRISELVCDWYNQLYKLLATKKFNHNSFEEELYFYSQNRIVLPELLKTITFLNGKKEFSKLIFKTEEFLKIVTDYQNDKHTKENLCTPLLDEKNEEISLDMKKLDSLVQEIAVITGKSLK